MLRRTESILEQDPFINEKKEFEEYEKKAKVFFNLLCGNFGDIPEISELQLEALIQLVEIYSKELVNFEEQILSNPETSQIYQIILKNKEKFYQKMLYRYAKFISVSCYGEVRNLETLNISKIKNSLKATFKELISVVKEDIPKYDLLFKELEETSSQQKFIELYILRDGVYAYESRRALDISRRRKLKGSDRQRRNEIKINNQSLNYNSFIKDYFTEEIKKRYLKDQGVEFDKDFIIFDTGFRGSIPEQILQILGRSEEEIEGRIKILGTDYYEGNDDILENKTEQELFQIEKIRKRIIKGVKNSFENYEHVGKIEERGKKFLSASGIYLDKDNKLQPAISPIFNEYFYEYELIELFLRQYFYNK